MRPKTVSLVLSLLVILILFPMLIRRPAEAQGTAEERLLSRLPKWISDITWITDETVLASVSFSASSIGEIAFVSVSTGEMKSLAGGKCASPSPDRTRLAWVPGPKSRGEVWILDLRKSQRRQLISGLSSSCLKWSPDGRWIAVTNVSRTSSIGEDILIISADSGRIEHAISAGDSNISLGNPAWNSDSQKLIFTVHKILCATTCKHSVNRIDGFDLSARKRFPIVEIPREDHGASDVAISPDGRLLLFVILKTPGDATLPQGIENQQIFAHDGTSIRFLTTGHSPTWHPDGKSILFARGYDCTHGWICAGADLYTLKLSAAP